MESFVREPEFTTTITITGQESRCASGMKIMFPQLESIYAGQQSASRIGNIMFDTPPQLESRGSTESKYMKTANNFCENINKDGWFYEPYSLFTSTQLLSDSP
jgi:hypothetical protein